MNLERKSALSPQCKQVPKTFNQHDKYVVGTFMVTLP